MKDGLRVCLRPIRSEDDQVLIDMFARLSPDTIYQRFFTFKSELSAEQAHQLSHVNYVTRMAIIAEVEGVAVGVARYEGTTTRESAELSLAIVDGWQNRGLGRILTREILAAARANGFKIFRADVLAGNRRMLKLLASEAKVVERSTDAGVISLKLNLLAA